MKLDFILTAWLILLNLLALSDSSIVKPDMERLFDVMSEEMLSSLTRSLSQPLIRQKRELGVRQDFVGDSGMDRLASIRPVANLCHPAVRTLFLDVSNRTYVVCITATTTDSPAEVVLGYYKDHIWTPVRRWMVNKAVDAAAFHFGDHIYILVVDSETSYGPELVKINLRTNSLVREYVVSGNYATSIAVWHTKTDGKLNLAIANSNGLDSTDLSTEVLVYSWRETYFDSYSSFRAYDVKDIEPFHIHGVAYLAVANFRRGRTQERVDSEIFRLDQDEVKWISHQKMRTSGAMDWEFFTLGTSLGQEFFLALANKGYGHSDGKSMIYKFVDDKFVPFQCLQTQKANSLASFSKDGMFLLAVGSENDAVHLYQYDGWRFSRSQVQSTGRALSDGAVHLKFHMNLKGVLLLGVSNPRHALYPSLFEVSFVHENSLSEWRSQSSEWCLNSLSQMESRDLDKTLNFSDVIFTDQSSVSINGDVIFDGGLIADTLKTSKLTDLSTQEVFDNHLLKKLASLQRRLDVIKQKLGGFSDVLKKSLRVDGNQTIKSNLNFQDAFFSCKNRACSFENLYTEILNGERIDDWDNRVVFTDSKQVMNGSLMATALNASAIHALGLADGINTADLITKSGSYSIGSHKVFRNSVSSKDIEISGKLDGVTVSSSTILLSTGYQIVRGNISFENLNTTWMGAEYVNRRNLTQFYSELVFTDKSSEILGAKTFSDVFVSELDLKPGSAINGVDFVDLWERTLWTDGSQRMHAETTFLDVTFEKNLDVSISVNGMKIPSSRIVDTTESATFKVTQVFQNTTHVANLEVFDNLNGVSVLQAEDGTKQLDAILKIGNQKVTGAKTFDAVHLDADSDVKGVVDGVDLSELQKTVLRKNTSVVTNGTWVFKSLIIKGALAVEGKMCSVDIKKAFERSLKLNESHVPEMIFESNIEIDDLQNRRMNDIDIKNEFVLVNSSQTIAGRKTFDEVVLLDDSLLLGLVNNLNLSFLNEVLLVIGDQRLKSQNFNRNIIVQHLSVDDTLNGIPMADIVSLKGGKIFGSRLLNGATFTRIEAKNVEVTGRVNNIDLTEMVEDTMTYYESQEVTGVKDVVGPLRIMSATNLQTNDFSGIDWNALWANAVFTDIPQEMDGVLTFEKNSIFQNVSFHGTFDGVSEWDMHNWLLTYDAQTVVGPTVFKNSLSANKLNVHAINSQDLEKLESDLVKVNEANAIASPLIFEKSVFSRRNLTLTGKVQGVDLSEEAPTREDTVGIVEKRFSKDVTINEDLSVTGLINGIDIKDICNRTFLRSEAMNIARLVIRGNVILEEGTVHGNVAGVNGSILKEVPLRNDGSEISFSGWKSFTNVTFEGPISLKGQLGKIDLNVLAANYMSKSKKQEIPVKILFDEVEFRGILSVINLKTADKQMNNIDLARLSTKLLTTSQSQTVTVTYYMDDVHFENDAFVAGKVNNHEVPGGLMRHNHTNYIQSPKLFERTVIVLGDLDMENSRTIQSIDVSEWLETTVFKEGRFRMDDYKIFNKLHLNDLKVEGKLDELKITEESLLMVYGNQVIKKRKLVTGSIDVEKSLNINGLINLMNVTDLANRAVQRDSKSISGSKYFVHPLTTLSLEAPSLSGIDIAGLDAKLNTTLDFDLLEEKLEEIEVVVSHMQMAFNSEAVIFQYYELFDEFAIPSAYDWLYVSGPDCGELLLLLHGSNADPQCSSIGFFGFDKISNAFIPARQELTVSHSASAKSLFLNSTFLFVANLNTSFNCSGDSIDIYEWNLDSFKKVHSLLINQLVDMVVFKDGARTCLVVLEGHSKVYCSMSYLNWTLNETLFTRGGQKIAVLKSRKTLLAISAEDTSHTRDNYVDGQGFIDIYLWNSSKREFSAPRQTIRSILTQSIALMEYIDRDSEALFLVVSEGSIPNVYNEPKILIYRYDDRADGFKRYQEIKDYGSLEWQVTKTGEMLLFVVDSLRSEIKVYQYKGESKFVKIDTIKSIGATKAHSFTRSDPEDWFNHYVALAGPRATMAQPIRGEYYAKILKSKMKGKRPLY